MNEQSRAELLQATAPASSKSPGFKLKMFHGRKSIDEQLDDWGFDGPTLEGVKYLHIKYWVTFNLGFHTVEQARFASELTGWKFVDDTVLEVEFREDMMMTHEREPVIGGLADKYYGDWKLFE